MYRPRNAPLIQCRARIETRAWDRGNSCIEHRTHTNKTHKIRCYGERDARSLVDHMHAALDAQPRDVALQLRQLPLAVLLPAAHNPTVVESGNAHWRAAAHRRIAPAVAFEELMRLNVIFWYTAFVSSHFACKPVTHQTEAPTHSEHTHTHTQTHTHTRAQAPARRATGQRAP